MQLILLFFYCLIALPLTAQINQCETVSGLKYRVYQQGSGPDLTADQFAYVHVNMRLGDSVLFSTRDVGELVPIKVFSREEERPSIDPVSDVLRYLKVGDSVTITQSMADLPQGNIPPEFLGHSEIYYDLAVYEGISQEDFEARQAVISAEEEEEKNIALAREPALLAAAQERQADYQAGQLQGGRTTASGLEYVIHEQGTGPLPEPGEMVTVHYIGMLAAEGTVFDQSFNRGSPIRFKLGAGQVITGWDEGIALLPKGSRATLIISAELGYGVRGTPNGSIPPNSVIMFYVELLE
ncbi:MAG: FKBP-type peptidyl-prolyl cis-trans isomerase [Bacteroidota bacterium]